MAGLQIGRLFADYTVNPSQVEWQGSRLSMSGVVDIGSVDQAKAVREQIIAMDGNPDEPFVALQWDADPTMNGFYRVRAMATDPGLMHLVTGYLSWAAELERVSGSQFPALESHVTWQVATNTHSITEVSFGSTDVLQWAVPGSAYEFGPVSGTVSGSGSGTNVTSSTALAPGFGSLKFTTEVTIPSSGIMGWSVAPADYYHGNCRVIMDVGTATDQLVLGRRATDSYDWEVSNGLVRFWVDSADDSLRVEHWDFGDSVWRRPNATNYEFTFAAAPVAYHTMTILRNSPECVAVRLGCNNGSLVWQNRIYVDLMILRGSQTVYGFMSTPPEISDWDTTTNLGIATTASVASSSVTGGFTATSADANGMKFIVLTGTPACTNTLGSGSTQTTAAVNSLSFGLNASGTGTSGNNLEFFARRSEVTRVVAR